MTTIFLNEKDSFLIINIVVSLFLSDMMVTEFEEKTNCRHLSAHILFIVWLGFIQ